MREKVIQSDVIECVLGLGPNLFYNSPMEACVILCRMQKPAERRGRILFLNAVNEVTRERAQSFLTENHIQRIVRAYRTFTDEEGFARVASTAQVAENAFSLNMPLYVRSAGGAGAEAGPARSLDEVIGDWEVSGLALRESMAALLSTLK